MRMPGVEPGPRAWDACTLHAMYVFELVHFHIDSICLADVCNHQTMIIYGFGSRVVAATTEARRLASYMFVSKETAAHDLLGHGPLCKKQNRQTGVRATEQEKIEDGSWKCVKTTAKST